MEVKFRGTGLTRRQHLVFGEDGWVSGEIVSTEVWIGLKLQPLRLNGEKVRSIVVRSEWNLAAGFFFLPIALLWLGVSGFMFAAVVTGGLAAFGSDIGSALLGVLVWLVLFLVAAELGAVTLRTKLEIRTEYWSDLFEVSVAPWSKRKVQRWADMVAEELGLPARDNSSPNDH